MREHLEKLPACVFTASATLQSSVSKDPWPSCIKVKILHFVDILRIQQQKPPWLFSEEACCDWPKKPYIHECCRQQELEVSLCLQGKTKTYTSLAA